MCAICESKFIVEEGTKFESIGLESANYMDIDLVRNTETGEYYIRPTSEIRLYVSIKYCPFCGKELK